MNEQVADQLNQIVRTNGVRILNDPARVRAFLNDLCAPYRTEINILIASLEDGILPDTFKYLLTDAKERELNHLILSLEENLSLSKNSARWAVETWLAVLQNYLQNIPVTEWRNVMAPAFGHESKTISSSIKLVILVKENNIINSSWIEIGRTPGIVDIPDNTILGINCLDISDDNFHILAEEILANHKPVLLNLSHSQMSDLQFACLQKASSLTHLDLSWCDKIVGNGFSVLSDIPQLSDLNLEECRRLSDVGIEHLSRLRSLVTLNLAHCSRITEAGIAHLSGNTTLKQLNISGCWQLTNVAIKAICKITSLNSLALSGCSQISDEGLHDIKNLCDLVELDISGCYQISPKMLVQLKHIQKLNVLY